MQTASISLSYIHPHCPPTRPYHSLLRQQKPQRLKDYPLEKRREMATVATNCHIKSLNISPSSVWQKIPELPLTKTTLIHTKTFFNVQMPSFNDPLSPQQKGPSSSPSWNSLGCKSLLTITWSEGCFKLLFKFENMMKPLCFFLYTPRFKCKCFFLGWGNIGKVTKWPFSTVMWKSKI